LPDRFAVPDREIWERGYAREAQRSLLPIAHSLDDALEIASAFVDPLFDIEGTATGTWDPQGLNWGLTSRSSPDKWRKTTTAPIVLIG
jgi:hypothetical protein